MFWNNKKNRIKLGFSEDIEPQDILLDSLAQKKEEELGISEKKFEVPVLKMAIKGLWGFSIFILLLLFAKTFQLQVLEHEKYSAMAEDNKFIITQIKSERGVIYDKDMKQLAFNKFSFDLICLKKDIPQEESEKQRVFNEVSRILKINPEELKSKIEKNKEKNVLVSANMGHQDLIILETKIQELPGFEIRNNETREYKDGPIFSHLMGYLGKITPEELKTQNGYSMADWIGKDGVEKEYEESGGGPAEVYRIKNGIGKLGFISSRTHPFCNKCTRLRLTSAGILLPCLDSRDGIEIGSMSQDQLRQSIRELAKRKRDAAKPCAKFESARCVSLSKIGG